MSEERTTQRLPANDCTIITVERDQSMTLSASRPVPASSVCSYTIAREGKEPSSPLSEGAVRVGNSLLTAHVPETAFLRDSNEDF